jgi:hypothetical protein
VAFDDSQRDLAMNWLGGGIGDKFSDPFFLESSSFIPTTLITALDYAGFLYYMNPQYQQASRRVVSHFITDFDFTGDAGDKDERDDFYDYLREGLNLPTVLLECGEEWAAYGNALYRIHFPFDRFLIDRRNDRLAEYSLDLFGRDAKFDLKSLTYEVQDPRTPGENHRIKLPFRDRRSTDMRRIRLRRLDPRRITLMPSWMSGKTQFIYRFEEWFLREIQIGRLNQVNETPLCMLKALANGQDFLFAEDEIYHLKNPAISGISNAGWGLPPTIANYRSIHQLQVYRKIDESVGLDYMLPFRLFSPNFNASTSDSTVNMLMTEWNSNISAVIGNRRKDQTAIHALPFPVNYQELGGQGKALVPKDVIEFQTNDMLDGMGYPAELFRGTLAMQNMPTAIRLFENSFGFLHSGFDGLCKWATRRILDYLNREQMRVELQLPSLADNIEKQYLYMQLVASGEISRAKAFKAIGIKDPVDEANERMDEDLKIEENRARKSEEFQRKMQAGSLTGGGGGDSGGPAPASGGSSPGGTTSGATPVTPLDIMSQAQEKAQELLQIQNVGDRRKELDKLRSTNPTLYAATKECMEQIRSQGESQGRAQAPQLAQQGAQPASPAAA